VNAAPVVDLNGAGAGNDATAAFTEQTPLVIAPSATIADVDSANLQSLTATLTSRPDGDAVESLSLNVSATQVGAAAGLVVSYTAATGVLSISGSASKGLYEAILDGIVYNNTSDAPTTTSRTVNVVANDGSLNSALQSVAISVTPVNDDPQIAGQSSGAVQEDAVSALQTSGFLTANDPDSGPPIWSIVGGATAPQTQDFRFQADNLKVVKNGFTFYEDTFDDGLAPPSGPAFPPATGLNASAYFALGSFTEAAGRLLFDGTQAITIGTTYGERTLLNSDISPISDPTNGTKGLKSNSDFTAEARFDLIIPEDQGDAYGIRLTDQSSTGPNNNSTTDLIVTRDATGVHVALREINNSNPTNAVTVLETANLTVGANTQIVLRLSYDHASYVDSTAGGSVTASFDLLTNGVVTTPTTTFSNHGTIFVGEDFTQVLLLGQTTQTETGVYKLAGTYGTLTIAQDGEWHYFLADQQANVKALAAGQTVTDSFTVHVDDGAGGFADRQVNITVTGTNDAPTISPGLSTISIAATDGVGTEAVDGSPDFAFTFTRTGDLSRALTVYNSS
jgi:VCBS repeat-containing protein